MKTLTQALLALAIAAPLQANAGTVDWAHWQSDLTGTMTQGSQLINVSYTGENLGVDYGAYIYDVPGSFTNAEVTNTPGGNGTIDMQGGGERLNTFHFDHPVVNPYIDLFSVGQGGTPVRFVFQVNGSDLSILAEGTGHWGGGTLVQSGNTVTGVEGNGLLKFNGTYSSISFYTPDHEYYYGATVGVLAAVPEPATYGMLLAGMGMLAVLARRRKDKQE